MPLEIRELNIKVQMGTSDGDTGSAGPVPAAATRGESSKETERIIARAVEEVLRIQQNRRER